MTEAWKVMAVMAHPDDESLGIGGTLAKYAAQGVEVSLVTATRGQRGRHFRNDPRPGDAEVGRVREAELHEAARTLGIREGVVLDYLDGQLDGAEPHGVVARIAAEIRRIRPHVVVTFDPFGGYGHPDHVAICQFTTAAVAAAADVGHDPGVGAPHQVAKLYWFVMGPARWAAYQAAFRTLVSRVDGEERRATPWPEWAITTRIDTREEHEVVWRAVQCHRSQLAIYDRLGELTPDEHRALWGSQTFYRAFSLVNGGRTPETDLLAGLRREVHIHEETNHAHLVPA